MAKAWGGRFQKETAPLMDDFHSSIHFDYRLAEEDIRGSIAHAKMLGDTGIITRSEADTIIIGLKRILEKVKAGQISWDPSAEDIHMNVEQLLIREIGELGKKLHTARSRNDQVALDTRLYLRTEISALQTIFQKLFQVLLKLAEREQATIMPGYTHLQRAQPVLLGHHLLAYFEMFRRDYQRLEDCLKRVLISPLGSGALAGTGIPIDREKVAAELGFSGITGNSIDGVSDRDFVIEFISVASLIMMHLSRFCEELVLWSSMEFGFVEMDDAYSTGSSIMPQKKNPDVAELIRGKTGRVYGNLMAILTVMKGLPLAYNKDMQEDKEALFDTVDTVKGCLTIFIPMLDTLSFNRARMLEATKDGFLNATDLADYLVKKGLPFRTAHAVVGKLVKYCLDNGKRLEDLSLKEFQKASSLIGEDIYQFLKIEKVVEVRNSVGGTGFAQVRSEIEKASSWLESIKHYNKG
ncbi:MAG: argininosuccinate lyase [Firmicutes bacterium]|nr:argininosuccinate lyase [Bacillota bacterium]